MRHWMAPMSAMVMLATACASESPPKDGAARNAAVAETQRIASVLTPAEACDSVAARWRADTAYRVTRDPVDSSRWSRVPRGIPVCAVDAYAAAGPTAGVRPDPSYWSDSTTQGWRNLVHEEADGPDGYSRMMQHGDVRCLVDYAMDGDDDADSTYVNKPWIRQRTHCWRQPLVAGDTAE